MISLIETMFKFLILILIIAIIIYIITSIFLNKFNKLVYGKGTPMAWIPIVKFYLLGKLTINKLVGWILIIFTFLTGEYTTTVNGDEITHTILPSQINSIVSKILGLAIIGLYIYAVIKYIKLKKEGSNTEPVVAPQQPESMMSNPNMEQPYQQQPEPMMSNPNIGQSYQQPTEPGMNQPNQNFTNNEPTNQNPTNPNNY